MPKVNAPTPPNAALMRYRLAVAKYLDRVQVAISGNPALLQQRLNAALNALLPAAKAAGKASQAHSRAELARIFQMKIPASAVGDKAVIDAFVAEQVDLFRKLQAEIVTKVASQEKLEALKLAENRAKLIAADQTHKVGAEALAYYGQSVGSSGYFWITRKDERVRPGHRALHGTRQSWSNPPVTSEREGRNHPGAAIMCRCQAAPIKPS